MSGRHRRSAPVAFTLGALAAACGDHGMGDADAMHAAIADARLETHRHHDAVAGSSDVTAAADDADRHARTMGAISARMRGRMGRMTHCAGADADRMHEEMGRLEAAVHGHAASLRGAADVDTARSRCTDHVTSTAQTLDAMEHNLDGMHCMRSWRL